LDDLVSCPFCPFQKIMQDPNDKAGTNNQWSGIYIELSVLQIRDPVLFLPMDPG
jgi:hypothetical protein